MDDMKASIAEFASAVWQELRAHGVRRISRKSLMELCEVLFAVSLKTEEGQRITLQLTYLNPTKPDPKPPEFPRRTRWSSIPLQQPIPLTVSGLVKLAKATDPRTSSLAVYATKTEGWQIWGFVDQGIQAYQFRHFDRESAYVWPGQLQISVEGIGQLVAFSGFHKLAELRVDVVSTSSVPVFDGSPIVDALYRQILDIADPVEEECPPDYYEDPADIYIDVEIAYWETLSRLLIRTRNYRHGGAFLITPELDPRHLRVKYPLEYPRLRTGLQARLIHHTRRDAAEALIREILDRDDEMLPVSLFLEESLNKDDRDDAESELEGALWFVSLLSRVDGAVVLTPDLVVKGFGAEITSPAEPGALFRAADAEAKQLSSLDYQHFGTRHRSVMRYCSAVPGSVGFVVSQDGDVRVMTLVGEKVVMWENIRLDMTDEIAAESRRQREQALAKRSALRDEPSIEGLPDSDSR